MEQQQEKHGSAATDAPEPSALGRRARAAWRRAADAFWTPLPGALGRLAGSRPRRWLAALVGHWAFELVVILAVVTNTVLLSMQYAGMSDAYAASLDKANNVLSFVFMAEALIKIGAQGRVYFTSLFNCFDVRPGRRRARRPGGGKGGSWGAASMESPAAVLGPCGGRVGAAPCGPVHKSGKVNCLG
jgi:hypothetical protein